MGSRLSGLAGFLRCHAMPVAALAAALITCCFVPPDGTYGSYIDLETLGRLACVLAVVGALGRAGVFQALAARLAARCRSARSLVGVLVGVTALASMVVTNDMALVALLPLAAAALVGCHRLDLLAPTFVLQGFAANLCGMLLPFGNPQNIYLSAWYGVDLGSFVAVMAPPFALSAGLSILGCVALADRAPVVVTEASTPLKRGRVLGLAALLALCIAAVLGVVPVWAALVVVFGALLMTDRAGLGQTDWGLIVTFAAFFVFSGNMARIPAVAALFEGWLEQGAFVPGALLSQIISNVPAAVVLARFTGDWPGLLMGVNVGGVGTPIASLATLIVVAQYGAIARTLGLPRGRLWPLLLGINALGLLGLLGIGVLAGW